jgi:hypothetical protein
MVMKKLIFVLVSVAVFGLFCTSAFAIDPGTVPAAVWGVNVEHYTFFPYSFEWGLLSQFYPQHGNAILDGMYAASQSCTRNGTWWPIFNYMDTSGVRHYYYSMCEHMQDAFASSVPPTLPPTGLPPTGTPVATPVVTSESQPRYVFDVFKVVCPSTPVDWVATAEEDGTYRAMLLANGSQIGDWFSLYSDGSGFSVSSVLVAGTQFPEGTIFEIRTNRELLASFTLTETVNRDFQGNQVAMRDGCYEVNG